MHVLMLNYEFPPLGGGAGNANYFLFKELQKTGNLKIDLVTSSVSSFRIEKFSANINIHYLDIGKQGNLLYQSNKDLLRYSYKAYFYSKQLIKNNQFDFIHAFFGIPCGYIAYKLRLPFIISLRGSDVPGHNPGFKKIHKLLHYINRKTWRNAKEIIANSEDLKRTALETNFVDHIQVIPNGVDCNLFKPYQQKKSNEDLSLLFVGRLNKVKNIDVIIRTVAELSGVILNIVGDGPEKENLQVLVQSLNITGKVNFLNRRSHEELKDIYNQNDIFLLLSLGEGGSNVVMEAMACGMPAIIMNTGGAENIIKGNGFVLNKLTIEILTEKINYFIKNREEIMKMGKRSRDIAESFSWENTAKQYSKIYNDMVSLTGG